MRLLVFTILFFGTSNGFAQTVVSKVIHVDPQMSYQNYEHFKRLTLSSPDSEAEFIDGFDFEWGYDYTLKVKETRLAFDLSDGTRFEYALMEIVGKEAVADSVPFRLYLDAHVYYASLDEGLAEEGSSFKKLNDSTFTYFDEVEIQVPSALKNQFEPIFLGKTTGLGVFKHLEGNSIRLTRIRN